MSDISPAATALITLGGQAQVVTLALDALLAQGEAIAGTVVLHFSPADPRIQRALAQLSAEFAGGRYQGRPMQFRRLALSGDAPTPGVIATPLAAESVWMQGRDVLAELKRTTPRLHLCIAGGPRLLALTLVSAAAWLCDERDRLWHLYTPRDFLEQARDGALLHAPPEAGVMLLPVPLMPWGAYLPGLRALTQPARPVTPPDDAARCAAVWAQLTEREKAALRVLAAGRRPQEAADALGVTLKTLDTFKTKILAECRVAWELPEGQHLTYHFLREQFGTWVRMQDSDQRF